MTKIHLVVGAVVVFAILATVPYIDYYASVSTPSASGLGLSTTFFVVAGLIAFAVAYVATGYPGYEAIPKLATVVGVALLGYAAYQGYSTTSFSLARGGGQQVAVKRSPCTERVQETTLDAAGKELNPGGGCHIRLHEVNRDKGDCVNVFDRSNRPLGDDCARDIDLAKKYPAKFASARGGVIPVIYVLCEEEGRTTKVVDGCP